MWGLLRSPNYIYYIYHFQDLIVNLATEVKSMNKTLKDLMQTIKNGIPANDVELHVKQESDDPFKGVNLLRIPSRDAYSYALQLMDIFFTKEELGSSLLFKSKKSGTPGLDHDRVEKLLQYVEKRYGDKWELKTLTAKANQKCRDSKEKEKKDVSLDSIEPEHHDSD